MVRRVHDRLVRWVEGDRPGSLAEDRNWVWGPDPFSWPKNAILWDQVADKQAALHAWATLKAEPVQALQQFQRLADDGSVWAMERTGWLFAGGAGCTLNVPNAKFYLERAVDGGSDFAAAALGRILIQEGDLARAKTVLRNAVAAEYPPAMFCLATAYMILAADRPARNSAQALLERAAALGYRRARAELTRLRLRGRFGLQAIPKGVSEMIAITRECLARERQPLSSRAAAGAK